MNGASNERWPLISICSDPRLRSHDDDLIQKFQAAHRTREKEKRREGIRRPYACQDDACWCSSSRSAEYYSSSTGGCIWVLWLSSRQLQMQLRGSWMILLRVVPVVMSLVQVVSFVRLFVGLILPIKLKLTTVESLMIMAGPINSRSMAMVNMRKVPAAGTSNSRAKLNCTWL